jgi:hypothetical protein
MKSIKIETVNGNITWLNEQKKRHRLDGPAVEWYDGSIEWWVDGKRHRMDGPAVEQPTNGGYKAWWVNDKLHRTDGPAISCIEGLFWYDIGRQHRLDGPAFIARSGLTRWTVNDTNIEIY